MESQQDIGVQQIPANVYRSADRVTVAAPMPGLEPENITVQVAEGPHLTIHGDLRGALKGDKDIVLDEWTPGPYHREIELPEHVDGQRANVTYNNGVLVVSLPLSGQTNTANLTLEEVAPTQGKRAGSRGHAGEERPSGTRTGSGEATTSYTTGEVL